MRWLIVALVMLLLGGLLGHQWGISDTPDRIDRLGPLGEGSDVTPASVADNLKNSTTEARPRLELLDGLRFDFGTMKRYSTDSHPFRIRNAGTAPLRLNMGPSTCSCTIGELEETELAPGDVTEVKLTWTVNALEPKFTQMATIYSNDPNQTETRFMVTGTVVDTLSVVPSDWTIGESTSSEPKQIKATVYSFDPRPLAFGEGRWLDPDVQKLTTFNAVKREYDQERDGAYVNATAVYELTIDIAPGLTQGPFQKVFRIDYALGDEAAKMDMMTAGRVTGDVTLAGSRDFDPARNVLSVGDGTSSSGEGRVFIRVSGQTRAAGKLKILRVTPENALEAELGEPRRGERVDIYPLVVRIRPDAPPGTRRAGLNKADFGGVFLGLEDSDEEVVRIPVVFAIP